MTGPGARRRPAARGHPPGGRGVRHPEQEAVEIRLADPEGARARPLGGGRHHLGVTCGWVSTAGARSHRSARRSAAARIWSAGA